MPFPVRFAFVIDSRGLPPLPIRKSVLLNNQLHLCVEPLLHDALYDSAVRVLDDVEALDRSMHLGAVDCIAIHFYGVAGSGVAADGVYAREKYLALAGVDYLAALGVDDNGAGIQLCLVLDYRILGQVERVFLCLDLTLLDC